MNFEYTMNKFKCPNGTYKISYRFQNELGERNAHLQRGDDSMKHLHEVAKLLRIKFNCGSIVFNKVTKLNKREV
jgi:hypothetical protein